MSSRVVYPRRSIILLFTIDISIRAVRCVPPLIMAGSDMFQYLRAVVIAISLLSAFAHAGVIIHGTRIIFDESSSESVIKVSNNGSVPVLLQAWLDEGNPDARPENINAPFSLTPPVVRLDQGRGQTIRILRIGGNLPSDRESLYWFNLLEIPPKVDKQAADGKNLMQMAFRSRLKFFYRPASLSMSPDQAYENLKFASRGGKIVIRNDSPYYVTLRDVDFHESEKTPVLVSIDKQKNKMIAPFSDLSLSVSNSRLLTGAKLVKYKVVNDFGGESAGQSPLIK